MIWMLYGILSAVFAALVAIFGKVGMQSIDPLVATTLRACIMAGTLVAATIFTGKFTIPTSATPTNWLFIILSALAGAASWVFYFSALQQGPVTQVAALDRLSLVFTAFLGVLFLGEVTTVYMGLGVVLMVLGAWAIVHK